jgi:FkbM family methyltransferase
MTATLVKLVSRHWPFANGSGRFIDKFGGGIDLGSGERVCTTSDGFQMSVLADDLIGRHLLLSGKFDRSMLGVLLDFGEPGDQCVDIGANVGYVSCLMLHNIPGSKVLSIEPQPAITGLLRANLSRFPAGRWELVEAGLSDAQSEGFLELNSQNRGGSKLVTEQGRDTVAVPLLPAGDVLGKLDKIDLVKIDVEGHEDAVFRSARDIFGARQPRAILFEEQKAQAGPTGPIGGLLAGIGYKVYGIGKTLTTTTLQPATDENAAHFNDFLAISTKRTVPAKAKARYGL